MSETEKERAQEVEDGYLWAIVAPGALSRAVITLKELQRFSLEDVRQTGD